MFECVVQLNYALLNFIIGLITNDVLIIKLKAVEVRMMSEGNRIYMAIDLKSFYASVECVERELDPHEYQSGGC